MEYINHLVEFEYEKFDDGYCLLKYNGDDENVVVADTYMGEPVFGIWANAFKGNSKIKRITLPNTITRIGVCAFYKCKSLESITLPDDVQIVENASFSRCYNLTEIVWNDRVKIIDENAFAYCTSLEKIVFPENLLVMKKNSFLQCENLKELRLNAKLKSVKSSFIDCSSLETVEFAHNDEELQNLYIQPNSIPFTENLKNVSVALYKTFSKPAQYEFHLFMVSNFDFLPSDEQESYKSILNVYQNQFIQYKKLFKTILENRDSRAIMSFFELGFELTLEYINFFIENSINAQTTEITSILLEYRRENFDEDTIEDALNCLEPYDVGLNFQSREDLAKKWVFTELIGYITIYSYKGTNTKEVIPAKIDDETPILYIGSSGTYTSSSSPLLYIGSSGPYTSHSGPLFSNNYGCLEELVLLEGIVGILENCFKNNPYTSIPNMNFNNIKKIHLPNSLAELGEKCFYMTNITEIVLPDMIEEIPKSAFELCKELEKVVLPANLRVIEDYAFSKCSKLKELILPDNLRAIEDSAFQFCDSLTEIVIPDSVITIGFNSFAYCENLEKIVVAKDGVAIYNEMFTNCCKLKFVGYADGTNIINDLTWSDANPN